MKNKHYCQYNVNRLRSRDCGLRLTRCVIQFIGQWQGRGRMKQHTEIKIHYLWAFSCCILHLLLICLGWAVALRVGRLRVWFPIVSFEFFIDIILPASLWPGGWLSLEQKWVPVPGVKAGRCVGLTTLPPPCTDCLEIWELQPSGTLKACPGL